jgi:hypothetical protein
MSNPIARRVAAALSALALTAGGAGLSGCGDDEDEETVQTPDAVTAPSGAEQADTAADESKSLGGAAPQQTPQEAGGSESYQPPGQGGN